MKLLPVSILLVFTFANAISAQIYLKFNIGGSIYLAKGYNPPGDGLCTAISEDIVNMSARKLTTLAPSEFCKILNNPDINGPKSQTNANYLVLRAECKKDLKLDTQSSELDSLWRVVVATNFTKLEDNILYVYLLTDTVECRLSHSEREINDPVLTIFSSGISLLKQNNDVLAKFNNISSNCPREQVIIISNSKILTAGEYQRLQKSLHFKPTERQSPIDLGITLDASIPDKDLRWWEMSDLRIIYSDNDVTAKIRFQLNDTQGQIRGCIFRDYKTRQLHILPDDQFMTEDTKAAVAVNPTDFHVGMAMDVYFFSDHTREEIEGGWSTFQIFPVDSWTSWPIMIEYR